MEDSKMKAVVDIALSQLSSWYETWEKYKDHWSGEVRRGALKGKCWALFHHDRILITAQRNIDG